MIRCIAIDDEPPALKVIEKFCALTPDLELIKTFVSPTEALSYLKNYPVDLLFLDINMPSISGIELFKKIQQPSMVIFTTAYGEFAVEGFNLSAIDFLLKPFSFERFSQAIIKALDFYNFNTNNKPQQQEQYIFIRADYSLHKINLDDIDLIEGLDDYLKIHLSTGKKLVARITMKAILEKLPSQQYKRVHRSFIVPMKKISAVRKKTVYLLNYEIPIGTSYEVEFMQHLRLQNSSK